MTSPIKHYSDLINKIFGQGFVEFDITQTHSNPVLGALFDSANFPEFNSAFEYRLKRISAAINLNPSLQFAIKGSIKQIADYSKWDGFYAELAALDFLLDAEQTNACNLSLDITLPSHQTIASDMKMQNANLDCHLTVFDTYLDFKILGDKSTSILNGIIKQVKKEKGVEMGIFPSFNADISYEEFQNNRVILKNELLGFVDLNNKEIYHESSIIPSLSYNLAWQAGVYSSVTTYDPLQHATNHHQLLFKHASKFHRTHPSFITFVHMPWFSEKLSPFANEKEIFYREFSSIFFENYKGSSIKANTFEASFNQTMTADEVTKNLSGIIFLEDNAVLTKTPTKPDIRMYYFLNKTAQTPIQNTSLENYLQSRGTEL